jgi:hypothetical protein
VGVNFTGIASGVLVSLINVRPIPGMEQLVMINENKMNLQTTRLNMPTSWFIHLTHKIVYDTL